MYADLVLARWTLEFVAKAKAKAKAYSAFSTQYSVTTTQG